jgi:hypothetical protein
MIRIVDALEISDRDRAAIYADNIWALMRMHDSAPNPVAASPSH